MWVCVSGGVVLNWWFGVLRLCFVVCGVCLWVFVALGCCLWLWAVAVREVWSLGLVFCVVWFMFACWLGCYGW